MSAARNCGSGSESPPTSSCSSFQTAPAPIAWWCTRISSYRVTNFYKKMAAFFSREPGSTDSRPVSALPSFVVFHGRLSVSLATRGIAATVPKHSVRTSCALHTDNRPNKCSTISEHPAADCRCYPISLPVTQGSAVGSWYSPISCPGLLKRATPWLNGSSCHTLSPRPLWPDVGGPTFRHKGGGYRRIDDVYYTNALLIFNALRSTPSPAADTSDPPASGRVMFGAIGLGEPSYKTPMGQSATTSPGRLRWRWRLA